MTDRKTYSSPGAAEKEVSRRAFLGYAAAALGAFVVSFAATPVVGSFLSPALKKGSVGSWKNLGSIENYQVGVPKSERVSLIKKDGWVTDVATTLVWVVRTDKQSFAAYNAHCTHLGCIVGWHPEDQTFKSPCHDGVFAMKDGAVLAGPPPRSLDTLEYKIEKGELWVNYQDFRLGIGEKVPI